MSHRLLHHSGRWSLALRSPAPNLRPWGGGNERRGGDERRGKRKEGKSVERKIVTVRTDYLSFSLSLSLSHTHTHTHTNCIHTVGSNKFFTERSGETALQRSLRFKTVVERRCKRGRTAAAHCPLKRSC